MIEILRPIAKVATSCATSSYQLVLVARLPTTVRPPFKVGWMVGVAVRADYLVIIFERAQLNDASVQRDSLLNIITTIVALRLPKQLTMFDVLHGTLHPDVKIGDTWSIYQPTTDHWNITCQWASVPGEIFL
jgi:hypothetical protein